MTFQAPSGWQFPVHGTHDAAPFGPSTPMRMRSHRALRLMVTAGTWAAGLCLVIGSIALVAETAGPTSATHVATAAGVARASRTATQASAGSGAATALVTRTFTGTGNQTTGQFRTAPHSRWELRWSYRCPARATAGHLIIREGDAGNAGVTVFANGPAGAGGSWTYSPTAAHYLVVLADCTWKIQVTGYR